MTPAPPERGRSARKRRDIVDAAAALFLARGYDGTSMDQVAAQAAVSKQTVYKQFEDKENLFAEVILSVSGTVGAFIDTFSRTLAATNDLERDLRELARLYLRTVMQPRVLRLRRLLIAETVRFPNLGRSYYEQGPQRVIEAIAACLQSLAARGLLRFDDPLLAAQHYAFLVLSIPLDRALVCGDDELAAGDLERLADAGVEVFLAAYRP
jgi:TetR/AcrR family transcriptional repressor of mexJK operon